MTNKQITRSYGWRPDLPDQRDVRFSLVYRVPATLPARADLRPICPPVEDQGQLGSCTAHALTGALETLENKDKLPLVQMSRLFVYYNERAIEHTITQDSGAMVRDGIKALVKQGCCAESKWPYAVSKFTSKPTAACYKDGMDHQITSYQRIDTLDQMRACLAAGFPFVFGFTVYESFESQAVAKTGTVNMPKTTERRLADMPCSPWVTTTRPNALPCGTPGGRAGASRGILRSRTRIWKAGTWRMISGRSGEGRKCKVVC